MLELGERREESGVELERRWGGYAFRLPANVWSKLIAHRARCASSGLGLVNGALFFSLSLSHLFPYLYLSTNRSLRPMQS